MKALFWAKVKACAIGFAAVLFLGAMTPTLYRAFAAGHREPGVVAPPVPAVQGDKGAPEVRAAAKPFIPKGGKIIAQAKLPGPLAPGSGVGSVLHWNFDHTRILFPMLSAGAPKREGDNPLHDYDIYAFDIKTQKSEKLFSYAGKPLSVHWAANDNVLVSSGPQIFVFDPKGAKREIRVPEGHSNPWDLRVSPAGRHFFSNVQGKGDEYLVYTVLVASIDGQEAKALTPPTAAKTAGMKLSCYATEWTAQGRIQLNSEWTTGKRFGRTEEERSWIYDPATGKFEELASRAGTLSMGSGLVEKTFSKPESDPVLWKMPEGSLRRILAEKPVGAEKRQPVAQDASPVHPPPDREAGTAVAFELLDANGKVAKRISVDTKLTGGADLWPRIVSADGRFVLFSTIRKFKYEMGAPWSVWEPVRERDMLLDLQEGKFVAGFNPGNVRPPWHGAQAVMPASRQFVIVDNNAADYSVGPNAPNSNHGIWSIPFDGAPRNLAEDFALPPTWVGTTVFAGPDWQRSSEADRFVIIARPQAFLRAPGPRQLLVFYNSAQPIRAFMSAGLEDEPQNVSWSRSSEMIAFTSGNSINVWKATEEAGEPGPKKTKDADF